MRINELGEFGLVERITRLLPPGARPDVVVGIGDDVAVLRTSGPRHLLATCDVQVEGVHFLRERTTPRQLGRKTVAINVSDMAAAGGSPLWALVSLALPPDVPVDFVDELYLGMGEELQTAGAAVVGGNLTRSDGGGIVIDLFLMGDIAPEHLVLRTGAKEGDLLLVTGSPGDSRAGLELTLHPGIRVSEESARRALDRHLAPTPRLKEGQALARSGLVHAMMDVSDGLLGDLGHICRASKVGAEVWTADLPVTAASAEIAAAAGARRIDWVLTGGEDYELLFTTAPESAPRLQSLLEKETGTPAHVIGCILPESSGIQLLLPDGRRAPHGEGPIGWDHFAAK
ncbi:MAG: thiamine-phosphate kinase [Syntrophobacteraceae bacterium]